MDATWMNCSTHRRSDSVELSVLLMVDDPRTRGYPFETRICRCETSGGVLQLKQERKPKEKLAAVSPLEVDFMASFEQALRYYIEENQILKSQIA